jgi:hypothetical protein
MKKEERKRKETRRTQGMDPMDTDMFQDHPQMHP